MAQKLLFPFKRGQIICGYKTKAYLDAWGYSHYGIDISSHQGYSAAQEKANDHTIYASGDGMVVTCEQDKTTNGSKSLGMAIAIQYNDCISHNGEIKSVVVRYMHCKESLVRLGDKVTKSTPIAIEGAEGTMSYHLHFEMDTDIKYPKYSPQVASGHIGWKHGVDSTVNPSLWLYQSAIRVQDPYGFSNTAWINAEDAELPRADTSTGSSLEKENADLKAEVAALKTKITQLSGTITRLEDEKKYLVKGMESLLATIS